VNDVFVNVNTEDLKKKLFPTSTEVTENEVSPHRPTVLNKCTHLQYDPLCCICVRSNRRKLAHLRKDDLPQDPDQCSIYWDFAGPITPQCLHANKYFFVAAIYFKATVSVFAVPVKVTTERVILQNLFALITMISARPHQTKVFSDKLEVYSGVENFGNYTQFNPIIASNQPVSRNFDSSIIYAPVNGRMIYAGLRFNLTN
jgi:hypothetical protein